MEFNFASLIEHRTSYLNLAKVQLRYADDKNFPTLLTKYELLQPVHIAAESLNQILDELTSLNIGSISIKGLFVLGISNFESMLGDLTRKFVSFFPAKLSMLPGYDSYVNFAPTVKNSGAISSLYDHIDLRVNKLMYENISNVLKKISSIFSTDFQITEEQQGRLIEIKETRNLLLHNNLVANNIYVDKSGNYKRTYELGTKLDIGIDYAVESMLLIKEIIRNISESINNKYQVFTFIDLIRRLWETSFSGSVKISDHLEFDTLGDYFSGHFMDCDKAYSSSEIFYLQFWRAQREGSSIDRFALVHISSTRVAAFLTEVFGELRLPYA